MKNRMNFPEGLLVGIPWGVSLEKIAKLFLLEVVKKFKENLLGKISGCIIDKQIYVEISENF